jgi:hypothetical protein
MRDRPITTSLVCWYLILASTWAIIHCFSYLNGKVMQARMAEVHLPIQVQVAQYLLGIAVPMVAGVFIWEGANWARVMYIGWGIANYLLSVIVVPNKHDLLPGLPIFAICAILLLLPGPRSYFLLERHFT